jgi:hypothetical protein
MDGRVNYTTGKLEVGDVVYAYNQPAQVVEVIGRIKEYVDGRKVWVEAVEALTPDGHRCYLINRLDFSGNWS